jgi:hypothetical protein
MGVRSVSTTRHSFFRRREIGQILIGRSKLIGGFYGASGIFLRPRKTKV